MDARSFLFVDVGYFVQSTIADQPPMWHRKIRFLTNYCRLNFHHLGNMIGARFEFVHLDTFIDSDQHVSVNVMAIVDSTKIFDEIVGTHSEDERKIVVIL